MLILSREDIKKVLEIGDLYQALEEGFRMLARGQCQIPLRHAINMSRYDGISLFMPSYCEGLGAAGIKLVTVMSQNPGKNLPLIHSNYLYASAETGQIVSIMDAEFITAMRTAATSAIATDRVSKSGGRVLAIFGTGVQAWSHAEVFAKLFTIGEILVFPRSPQAGERFAERIERQLRTPAKGATLKELKRAEIICTCTTSATPLFELKDIRPDAHINAVGAFRRNQREIGSDIVKKALLIVDSYAGAFSEAGEIVMAIEEGRIGRESVYASIDELVAEIKQAPEDTTQLTLFKSLGLAIEDLAAADLAYRKAKEKGIGKDVEI